MPVKPLSKYQFYITYRNSVKASAASKPVLDTSKTLESLGYKDCSLIFDDNRKNIRYYFTVLYSFVKLFFRIKSNSIVATQFPVTTLNYLFIYFIKFAGLRKVKFITIIHDINTLRDYISNSRMQRELQILSSYDGIVAHNSVMSNWLKQNGLKKSVDVVPLNFFDYLTPADVLAKENNASVYNEIAFAGHLAKSEFIYNLEKIKNWKFNIYGSAFDTGRNKNVFTTWKGEFSPDEVVYHLEGSFGLVWDGAHSNSITTNRFGNYMRYNNPFKFSLYLAAGLPVIAPGGSAIAKTIEEYKIGFLINSLDDLSDIEITDEDYADMKKNVKAIQKDIISGNFLRKAVARLEHDIS